MYILKFLARGWYFADYWLENFEVRVGESEVFGNNEICHKQLDKLDITQVNITCSPELYGNWVSINQTDRGNANYDEDLVLAEVRVFGSEYRSEYIPFAPKMSEAVC